MSDTLDSFDKSEEREMRYNVLALAKDIESERADLKNGYYTAEAVINTARKLLAFVGGNEG